MKFRYIPGEYPTPMLAINHKPNENFYNELVHEQDFIFKSDDIYTDSFTHAYNMCAYIIYDEAALEIKKFRMTSFAHFVYILRSLNKPFVFELNEHEYAVIKEDFETFFNSEFVKIG